MKREMEESIEKNAANTVFNTFLLAVAIMTIYLSVVFIICYFAAVILAVVLITVFGPADPQLSVTVAVLISFSILAGLDMYRAFNEKWSPATFLMSVIVFAGKLSKSILSGNKTFDYKINRPPEIRNAFRNLNTRLH
ncbi:hypothetical protein MsAc7_16250 [Methanolapillus millepedarum]|uniref:Transmembrane protein n=2 Tax=Methanolapillus millepedarum TaxID=3028296 RepID=A0AA96V4H5_9EURY|nr:hypothetical protein MsAc7_16250 [Methanosarcinaceae archaeon Ac7]